MITLRCTKKLQQHLGVKPEVEDRAPSSPLGDWYGNLVAMPQGPPLVLISNERTMLSIVVAHDADVLTEFKQRVIALLRRLELPAETVERETFHLQQIRIGKTKSRRVLGSMNDAALQVEARLFAEPRQSLEQVEDALTRNLYSMLDYRYPSELAGDLLAAPPAVTRTAATEKASQPECSDVDAASETARSGSASSPTKKRSARKRSKKAAKGRTKKSAKGSTRADGPRWTLRQAGQAVSDTLLRELDLRRLRPLPALLLRAQQLPPQPRAVHRLLGALHGGTRRRRLAHLH